MTEIVQLQQETLSAPGGHNKTTNLSLTLYMSQIRYGLAKSLAYPMVGRRGVISSYK